MIEVRPGRPGWAEVTFRHPSFTADVAVTGDFNQWTPHRLSDEIARDGTRHLTIEIPTGRRYQFRYLIDGEVWENDWQADDYVDNAHGSADSVIDLCHDGPHRDRLGISDPRNMLDGSSSEAADARLRAAQ